MSHKRIFLILSGAFIALFLMSMNIEVNAEDLATPTPTPVIALECPAGRYADAMTNSCVPADPGYYVADAGATAQTACPPGTYQPTAGATSCLPAEPGYFVDAPAAVAQTACAPGTYQPAAGATSCLLTSPGYFVDLSAAVAQNACAPGYYQPANGAVSCLAADPGYFVPVPAATEQVACPAGYTSDAAATECTPVEAGYTFTGFFAPVDMTALNGIKAGRAIPVKFSLGADYGLAIMAAGYPASAPIHCDDNTSLDLIEETVSAGSSSLSYDPDSEQYTYVWKTDRSWANSCRLLTVMLDDGSVHQASFKFNR